MNEIESLMSNWEIYIIGFFVVIFCFKQILTIKEWFCNHFGIETKKSLADKKQTEEIEQIKRQMEEIEKKRIEGSKNHKEEFIKINKMLDEINSKLDERKESEFKKLRHEIVESGEAALDYGSITIRKWKSLNELYDDYTQTYDGNTYVTSLMLKVNNLPVIGKLDEHGVDM